jgi:hypothetical protein
MTMTQTQKVRWSVLVLLGPVLVYLVIMLAGGLVGLVELAILAAIWLVGLAVIWWPRHSSG